VNRGWPAPGKVHPPNAIPSERFNDADLQFHLAVASASGNRILGLLVEGMEEPLRRGRLQSIRGHHSRSLGVQSLVEQHQEIFDKIVSRDARGAAASMRTHLNQTRSDLRAAFASQGGSGTTR